VEGAAVVRQLLGAHLRERGSKRACVACVHGWRGNQRFPKGLHCEPLRWGGRARLAISLQTVRGALACLELRVAPGEAAERAQEGRLARARRTEQDGEDACARAPSTHSPHWSSSEQPCARLKTLPLFGPGRGRQPPSPHLDR
jgi:hypothetical protein